RTANRFRRRLIWNGTGTRCSGHQPALLRPVQADNSGVDETRFLFCFNCRVPKYSSRSDPWPARGGQPFTLEQTQRNAWLEEIDILQNVLSHRDGFIYFEYAIPRMGKGIDVVL